MSEKTTEKTTTEESTFPAPEPGYHPMDVPPEPVAHPKEGTSTERQQPERPAEPAKKAS